MASAFKERLKAIKADETSTNYSEKKHTRATIKKLCETVSEELTLDEEKTFRALNSISKSQYGQVPQLILWLAGKYNWPLSDNTQASEIPELQERMLDTVNEFIQELNPDAEEITGDFFQDLRTAKGYNTFLDQESLEIIDGIEPDYKELELLIYTFVDNMKLEYCDFKISPAIFAKSEKRAIEAINIEREASLEALARHKRLTKLGEEA